jgi:uncharacterized iron-regulated membrane protein
MNGAEATFAAKPAVKRADGTLRVHLCLGLLSAVFLVLLAGTGVVMAFEQEIPRWLHPGLWYVKAQAQSEPESELTYTTCRGCQVLRLNGALHTGDVLGLFTQNSDRRLQPCPCGDGHYRRGDLVEKLAV